MYRYWNPPPVPVTVGLQAHPALWTYGQEGIDASGLGWIIAIRQRRRMVFKEKPRGDNAASTSRMGDHGNHGLMAHRQREIFRGQKEDTTLAAGAMCFDVFYASIPSSRAMTGQPRINMPGPPCRLAWNLGPRGWMASYSLRAGPRSLFGREKTGEARVLRLLVTR